MAGTGSRCSPISGGWRTRPARSSRRRTPIPCRGPSSSPRPRRGLPGREPAPGILGGRRPRPGHPAPGAALQRRRQLPETCSRPQEPHRAHGLPGDGHRVRGRPGHPGALPRGRRGGERHGAQGGDPERRGDRLAADPDGVRDRARRASAGGRRSTRRGPAGGGAGASGPLHGDHPVRRGAKGVAVRGRIPETAAAARASPARHAHVERGGGGRIRSRERRARRTQSRADLRARALREGGLGAAARARLRDCGRLSAAEEPRLGPTSLSRSDGCSGHRSGIPPGGRRRGRPRRGHQDGAHDRRRQPWPAGSRASERRARRSRATTRSPPGSAPTRTRSITRSPPAPWGASSTPSCGFAGSTAYGSWTPR